VYHFYKHELEQAHVEPSAYKPKVFDINGTISAKILRGDSLIRFVYKSQPGQPVDSTIELLRRVNLSYKDNDMIPSLLLGCRFLGAYNSLNEDMEADIYCCFYANDKDDLLKVVHLYKPGNVSAAFFYTKDKTDPTTRYKNDVALLLSAERPLNLSDTLTAEIK
jgi:hypothetical protein